MCYGHSHNRKFINARAALKIMCFSIVLHAFLRFYRSATRFKLLRIPTVLIDRTSTRRGHGTSTSATQQYTVEELVLGG